MITRRDSLGPFFIAVFAAALATSCQIEGERRAHTAVASDAAALRDAFNADAGKVRLIVLVAPT